MWLKCFILPLKFLLLSKTVDNKFIVRFIFVFNFQCKVTKVKNNYISTNTFLMFYIVANLWESLHNFLHPGKTIAYTKDVIFFKKYVVQCHLK